MVPTEEKGDEEGASLDSRRVHKDFCSSFFTILYNVLTVVSWPEAKSELSGLTLTQEASKKNPVEGARNSALADCMY
jgi:hypothetical protein